jgi:hypothetical protein
MYQNTASIIRHDLNAFVEEASKSDELLHGQKLLPIYSVDSRAGVFPKIEIGNGGELLKKDSTLRAPTGTYNETARKFTTDTYECLDRGLEERIDDVVVKDYAKFFDVEVLTSKLIMRTMKLDYEKRVYDMLQTAANNITNVGVATLANTNANPNGYMVATGKWGDNGSTSLDGADFPAVMQDVILEITKRGEVANTAILSANQFNWLRRTTKLNTFLYGKLGAGMGKRLVSAPDIASTFGLKNVYITHAHYDAGPRLGAANLTPMWDNKTMWVGNVQGGEISGGGFGRTVVWSKDSSGLFTTETYRSEPRRGDMVRVRHHTTEKVVNVNCGVLVNFDTSDNATKAAGTGGIASTF